MCLTFWVQFIAGSHFYVLTYDRWTNETGYLYIVTLNRQNRGFSVTKELELLGSQSRKERLFTLECKNRGLA